MNGWLVGRRPSRSASPSRCHHCFPLPLFPPVSTATRHKSLRLTGSHGITGTRDIYASAPTDRSITRNKEIANLLQEPPPPTNPSAPLRCRRLPILRASSSPSILSVVDSEGIPGPRVISAFMGRDRHGSSGNVPDDGEKSCDKRKRAREKRREKDGSWRARTSEIDYSRSVRHGEIHNIPFELSRKHLAITAGERSGMRENKSEVFQYYARIFSRPAKPRSKELFFVIILRGNCPYI